MNVNFVTLCMCSDKAYIDNTIGIEDKISKMQALSHLGIRLPLDDFGIGYLKRQPMGQLKIDKSFIQDIETDSDDRVIVTTIIAIARNLNVEGVETEEQKQYLSEKGCNRFQGYLFGRPQPINKFLESIKVG